MASALIAENFPLTPLLKLTLLINGNSKEKVASVPFFLLKLTAN